MKVTVTTSDVRRRQTGLPSEFARLPMRRVRAATAAQVYAHPRAELVRLTGLSLRLVRAIPSLFEALSLPDPVRGVCDGGVVLEA